MTQNQNVTSEAYAKPDSAIKPRRMQFNTSNMGMQRFVFQNNSLISTFFYALSGIFPDGERFFIHSVRHYQKSVNNTMLAEQIRGFIGQEAHHGRCHEDLNNKIEEIGIPISEVSENMLLRTRMLKNRFGPERQLALTVAMEHFTASLAEYILENPKILEAIPDSFRQMLLWHAVEEIEHKSVAFDVFRLQVNNEWMRRRVMVIAMISLFFRISYFQIRMLIKLKHLPSWQEWKQATRFFWGKTGILRVNVQGLKKFFRKGFHPSDIDQEHLIKNWQERFPDIAALEVKAR